MRERVVVACRACALVGRVSQRSVVDAGVAALGVAAGQTGGEARRLDLALVGDGRVREVAVRAGAAVRGDSRGRESLAADADEARGAVGALRAVLLARLAVIHAGHAVVVVRAGAVLSHDSRGGNSLVADALRAAVRVGADQAVRDAAFHKDKRGRSREREDEVSQYDKREKLLKLFECHANGF